MAAPPLSLDLTRRDSPNRRARTATSAAAQTLAETGTGKGNATGGMRILEEIKGGLRGSKKNGTGSPSAPKSRRSSRRCKQMGCSKRAHYGNDADKASVFCAGHRLAGQVDVKSPRCASNGCTLPAFYGSENTAGDDAVPSGTPSGTGDVRVWFCHDHRQAVHVNRRSGGHCIAEGCARQERPPPSPSSVPAPGYD
ncbi:hypothetical protein T484DRAFT_1902798 [Baffinella frigidus]|nr:hypothetical protein T484DRAFT_1902798 [Cryptophyta sp. CCMP2293]